MFDRTKYYCPLSPILYKVPTSLRAGSPPVVLRLRSRCKDPPRHASRATGTPRQRAGVKALSHSDNSRNESRTPGHNSGRESSRPPSLGHRAFLWPSRGRAGPEQNSRFKAGG